MKEPSCGGTGSTAMHIMTGKSFEARRWLSACESPSFFFSILTVSHAERLRSIEVQTSAMS